MTRYEPACEDGTLYLVADDREDRVEVGPVDDVVAAIGGDAYTIEYDERQRAQPWHDLDDGRLEVDVRDAVTTLPHTPDLVDDLREHGMGTDQYGIPARAVAFADRFVDILEQQGKTDD